MISDRLLDRGPQCLVDEVTRLVICSQDPTTFTEANSTYRIAYKDAPSISLVDGTVDGRAALVAAITDGVVDPGGGSTSGEAWALVDMTNSRLLRTGAITGDQVLTFGNTFTLAAFRPYTVRDPA